MYRICLHVHAYGCACVCVGGGGGGGGYLGCGLFASNERWDHSVRSSYVRWSHVFHRQAVSSATHATQSLSNRTELTSHVYCGIALSLYYERHRLVPVTFTGSLGHMQISQLTSLILWNQSNGQVHWAATSTILEQCAPICARVLMYITISDSTYIWLNAFSSGCSTKSTFSINKRNHLPLDAIFVYSQTLADWLLTSSYSSESPISRIKSSRLEWVRVTTNLHISITCRVQKVTRAWSYGFWYQSMSLIRSHSGSCIF